MDTMESIKQTFFQECEDLLRDLESGLILMNDGESDDETINSVFRAVHSIKGGAAAFELTDLVKFSHIFENTLDEIRAGRLETTKEVLTVLLQSSDLLTDLVEEAREGEASDAARSEKLMDSLQGFIGAPTDALVQTDLPEFEPQSMDDMGFQPLALDFGLDADEDAAPSAQGYTIHFTPTAKMYAHGNETARLFGALASLGEVSVTCNDLDLPDFDDIDPEGSYLSWEIELLSDCKEEDIRENFEFVEDDCELVITPLGGISLPDLSLPDLASFELPELEPLTEMAEPTQLPEFTDEAVSEIANTTPEVEALKPEAQKPKTAKAAKPSKGA
ncbi:MAG: Hpt domain-containing protein, partial [Robiginitomaculum sp.]|nr:Hpt domain-containing protein [Robiginitomaculum sp.]